MCSILTVKAVHDRPRCYNALLFALKSVTTAVASTDLYVY